MATLAKLPLIQHTFQIHVSSCQSSDPVNESTESKLLQPKPKPQIGKLNIPALNSSMQENYKSRRSNRHAFESELEQRALNDLKHLSLVDNSSRASLMDEMDNLISIREIIKSQQHHRREVSVDTSLANNTFNANSSVSMERPVQKPQFKQTFSDFYQVKMRNPLPVRERRFRTPSPKKRPEMIQVPGLQSPMKEAPSVLQSPTKSPMNSNESSKKELRFRIITNLIEEFKARKPPVIVERAKGAVEIKPIVNRIRPPSVHRGRVLFSNSINKPPGTLRKLSLNCDFSIQPVGSCPNNLDSLNSETNRGGKELQKTVRSMVKPERKLVQLNPRAQGNNYRGIPGYT